MKGLTMTRFGFDISRWQGNIDFDAIKNTLFKDFIMIKAGGADDGWYIDSEFESNYKKAKNHQIPVGCYYMCRRKGTSLDAITDCNNFLEILVGKQFEYPIVLDFENRTDTRINNTAYVNSFLGYLQGKGYYAALYTNLDYIRNQIGSFNAFDLWLAQWSTVQSIDSGIWQFQVAPKDSFVGIHTPIDCNQTTVDYETLIKKLHLNNFK